MTVSYCFVMLLDVYYSRANLFCGS